MWRWSKKRCALLEHILHFKIFLMRRNTSKLNVYCKRKFFFLVRLNLNNYFLTVWRWSKNVAASLAKLSLSGSNRSAREWTRTFIFSDLYSTVYCTLYSRVGRIQNIFLILWLLQVYCGSPR